VFFWYNPDLDLAVQFWVKCWCLEFSKLSVLSSISEAWLFDFLKESKTHLDSKRCYQTNL